MQFTSTTRTLVGVIGALAIAAGLVLVANFNMSTDYASDVATATRTVKVCHNNCRYMAPNIAFLLNLGLGLIPFGALALTAARAWPQNGPQNGPQRATAAPFRPAGVVPVIIGGLHGAAFACTLAIFSAPDAWRANDAPSSGYVYDASAHHGLSYAEAAQSTLAHITLPVWGTMMVLTLVALAVRARRGAPARRFDRGDVPAVAAQLIGIAGAAIVLMLFGHAIVDALIDSPFGPK